MQRPRRHPIGCAQCQHSRQGYPALATPHRLPRALVSFR